MQNREIGTRAFAGVGHGHADGSDLPLPGLAEEKRETEMDIRSPLDCQITGPGGNKIWKISRHGVVNKRDPNFHQAPEGAMRSLMQGGKEVHWWLPVPGCSGKWKMENWGGGATHSNQELEIDVSGSCVTFQATQRASAPRPPPMTGPVCCVGHQRQERKNFRLGHDAFRPIHREQRGPAPFGFPAKSPCRATTCTARIWKGRRARKERWLDLMSRDEGELGSRLCATATRP